MRGFFLDDRRPLDLLQVHEGGAGMSCIPFMQDHRLRLAALEMGQQVNGPLPFAIEQPLLIVSPWKEPEYDDLLQVGDTPFVSDRLKALIEEAGQAEVEFFPAFIENLDRRKSKLRPRVSADDMTPGNAGGGVRIDGYWWMNLWATEDLIDREASVGKWRPGDREIVQRLIGRPGIDMLDRDTERGLRIVLKDKPSKPVFRVKGLMRPLFVSADFMAVLRAANARVRISGFDLTSGA